jgi:PAS domain S-box-containing protein
VSPRDGDTGGRARYIPLKIAAAYAVLSALWILFSDLLLELIVPAGPLRSLSSVLKGWAFVAVTAAILYGTLQRYLGRIDVGERALRASERRLERIVATIPSAVVIVARNGRIASVNREAERLLRLKQGEITSRTFDDPAWRAESMHGRPLASGEYPVARVLATGETVSDVRYAIRHPDGSRTILSTNAGPLLDDEGELVAVVTASRDITDEYASEQKLVHVNRLYSMLSQTNHAIVRIDDEQELYTEACRITVEYGQFRMAWIGIVDRRADRVRPMAHAGDEAGYLDHIKVTVSDEDEGHGPVGTAARLGRTVISNDIEHDPYMRPWATAALERGYRALAAFPLRAEGVVYAVLAIYAAEPGFFDAEEVELLEDLADDIAFGAAHIRREVEQARNQQELRRWKEIFDKTRIGVVIAEGEDLTVISRTNPAFARMHGYEADEVVGMPLAAFNTPASGEALRERLELIDKVGHLAYDSMHVRKDGSTFPVSVDVTVVYDERGAVQFRIANIQDITERRAAEEELSRYREHLEELVEERTAELRDVNERLREATEAKGRFLANMSHELRTPLNSVIGFTGMMLQGMTGELNAEQEKQLGMVYRAGKQLLRLVNEVLDLSKIEAGRMRPVPVDFDLGALVDDVAATVRPLADEKDLALRVVTDDAGARLHTDRDKAAQILLNLLANAVKYTEAGEITLSARVTGGRALVTVTDTGVGVSPEDLGRIFDEFEQGGGPRRAGGTGLGLAISRRLAGLLGGTLDAASRPGHGSAFTLALPLTLPASDDGPDAV